jgi:hypothetical protein
MGSPVWEASVQLKGLQEPLVLEMVLGWKLKVQELMNSLVLEEPEQLQGLQELLVLEMVLGWKLIYSLVWKAPVQLKRLQEPLVLEMVLGWKPEVQKQLKGSLVLEAPVGLKGLQELLVQEMAWGRTMPQKLKDFLEWGMVGIQMGLQDSFVQAVFLGRQIHPERVSFLLV